MPGLERADPDAPVLPQHLLHPAGSAVNLDLPPVPADQVDAPVAAWSAPMEIQTYLPAPPDRYPAFLDSRVYQGSSGRVYPLPFHDRIATEPVRHRWQAIHLENQYLRLVVLPELGGRIHVGYDKTSGLDFFYRNSVIKPALVGLAGPWISGGVEFNWPQHHRPGTFLPTDTAIEHEPDGSITVWCSDHDPMTRMKGMHGIRLSPGRAVVELRVRLTNRTPVTQTFLWWANVAARVGDDFQSFFPPDVHVVADHAKRATTSFPRADGRYYGIDYPAKVTPQEPDADRLDMYRNIPVPTSYMCVGSRGDFFGGYDHGTGGGFVHVADHHISPGKKQWTWGNAPFGWSWDDNLTDGDGPYVELMAGVYTDNQPDFSFLLPGETKAFSQYWYPIHRLGVPQQATTEAALRVSGGADESSGALAVTVTRAHPRATVTVHGADEPVWTWTGELSPGAAWTAVIPGGAAGRVVTVESDGVELLRYVPAPAAPPGEASDAEGVVAAVEPPAPGDVGSVEELYLIGQHLEQYRHATRDPEAYWQEALRRDPGDSRAATALAARRLRAARYAESEELLRGAIRRATRWNPNPADGQALHLLGLTLIRLGRLEEAVDALAKATWNGAWRAPAGYELARLACRRGDLGAARHHLADVLRREGEHAQAANLLTVVLRRLGEIDAAGDLLAATLRRDPLDPWALDLAGRPLTGDPQTGLDVALEYAAAGQDDDALRVLALAERAVPTAATGSTGAAPLIAYHRAALFERDGRPDDAAEARRAARTVDAGTCLPVRTDDVDVLTQALTHDPDDARAAGLLASWWYDKGCPTIALELYRRSAASDPGDPVVLRNLGLAAYNAERDAGAAADGYARALAVAPADGRLRSEADQLAARRGVSAGERLAALGPAEDGERDDLAVARATLLVRLDRPDEALEVLRSRRFQPWEGGEGRVLAAWELACLAAAAARPDTAVAMLRSAITPPRSLGEARHPLANDADLQLALGDALAATGDHEQAARAWRAAADITGDFQQMSTQPFSEMTLYSVLACRRLGLRDRAAELTAGLTGYVEQVGRTPAVVDYFATSLPTTLLFRADPQTERDQRLDLIRRQLHALTDGPTAPAVADAVDPVVDDLYHRHLRFLSTWARTAGPRPSIPEPS